MEEKHKDLKSVKQKKLLQKIVEKLSSEHPDLYYMATTDVAAAIEDYIEEPAKLSADEKELMKGLDRHDIQVLLSLHH